MRIKAKWLQSNGPITIFNLLEKAGYNVYFVGGCVRNSLLNESETDIDLATDALPKTVTTLAKNNDLHVIPTGIEHGTVTIVIDKEPIEITTFRKDVQTDGRRAVVEFSTAITDDAKRRDFTMNALYAKLDGTVIDPLNGLDDLLARRVRFIENPNDRIREDYLRILRFFRFHALYGDPNKGLDVDALDACAQNLDGIGNLSKERIGHEMRKLLAADNPAPAMAAMAQAGVLLRIITGANTTSLAPLIHLEGTVGTKPDWMRRLLTIGGEDIKNALRLSKQEAKLLNEMKSVVANASTPRITGYKLGLGAGRDAMLVLNAHLGSEVPEDMEQELNFGAKAEFPISAHDLSDRFSGAALGNCLRHLEAAWADANLNLSKEQLLSLSNNLGQ